MRVLIAAAQPILRVSSPPDPWGSGRFSMCEVRESLADAVARAHRGVQVSVLPWATPENIRERLAGQAHDLVCLYCHGTSAGELVLEGRSGRPLNVDARGLGDILRLEATPHVSALVIMACYSDLLARELVSSEGSAIVAVAGGDQIAQVAGAAFIRAFLQSLGAGDPVGLAFKQGRSGIQHDSGVADLLRSPTRRREEADKLVLRGDDSLVLAVDAVPAENPHGSRRNPRPPFSRANPEAFLGRETRLVQVLDGLEGHRVVRIAGEPGVGKSALAKEAGHWWFERGLAPGGVFVHDTSIAPGKEGLVEAVTRGLGRSGDREDVARYLSNERCLVLLDNFETAMDSAEAGHGPAVELMEFLNEHDGPTRWLITSRRTDVPFRGEWQLPALGGLLTPEAIALVLSRLQARDGGSLRLAAYEEQDWRDLEVVCDELQGVPLLLELAADTITQRRWRPRSLLKALQGPGALEALSPTRLGLSPRHANYVKSLELSFQALPKSSQRAFVSLSLFEGGALLLAVESVLHAAGLAAGAVPVLANRSLVRYLPDPERFEFHPVIRRYAEVKAEAEVPVTQLELLAMREHLIGFYADYAVACQDEGGFESQLFALESANLRKALHSSIVICEDGAPSEQLAKASEACLVIGNAFSEFPLGDPHDNMRLAVSAYRAALSVRTREAYPSDWATIQNNLAATLGRLFSAHNDPRLLREAVGACRAALQVHTRKAYPAKWAAAKNTLANVLEQLFSVDNDPQLLREAVAAYRAALRVHTRSAYPAWWAGIQNNLALVLVELSLLDNDPDLLRKSIAACRAALKVYTMDAYPAKWAMTQNSLAVGLSRLFSIDRDPCLLREAAAALRATLLVNTREGDPVGWAMGQNNLGNVLSELSSIDNDPQLLHFAVDAFRAALEVRSREAYPVDWATTQNNLAAALRTLFSIDGDRRLLHEAIAAYRAALEVRTREALPAEWAGTQHNLAIALRVLFAQEQDPQLLRDAVAHCRAALKIYTQSAYAAYWAACNANLAGALHALSAIDNDPGLLRQAIAAYRAALKVHTREAHPAKWATTQESLRRASHELEALQHAARLDHDGSADD